MHSAHTNTSSNFSSAAALTQPKTLHGQSKSGSTAEISGSLAHPGAFKSPQPNKLAKPVPAEEHPCVPNKSGSKALPLFHKQGAFSSSQRQLSFKEQTRDKYGTHTTFTKTYMLSQKNPTSQSEHYLLINTPQTTTNKPPLKSRQISGQLSQPLSVRGSQTARQVSQGPDPKAANEHQRKLG